MSKLNSLVENFSIENFIAFLRTAIPSFKSRDEDLDYLFTEDVYDKYESIVKIGEAEIDTDDLIVIASKTAEPLTERTGKKNQYEIAKTILKQEEKDASLFVFYDDEGNFRFSFVKANYLGTKRDFTDFKRYTYFVTPSQTNKTFIQQVGNCSFRTLDKLQEAFSVEKLTKEFYNDLFKWYQWTLTDKIGITFPNNTQTSEDDRIQLEEHIIRLITRILFVWFIKQKKLIPNDLFDIERLNDILLQFEPNSKNNGNFYNAILQNLFFATLNKPVNERDFAKLKGKRDIKTFYRYDEMFKIPKEEILTLFYPIPFLNGGLFECLDKEQSTDGQKYHLDGFSRNDKRLSNGNYSHRAFIPNCVFFGDEKHEGLIPLLKRYNFTVEENAPNEIQVALDPELLGNVFENLLGAFNPETQETARKQSGSFYTPKEIVGYMVDESLKEYLYRALPNIDKQIIAPIFKQDELPQKLANNKTLCHEIISAIKKVKILDPACGSGAFPMGILNRIVEILEKLDLDNEGSHHDLKLHLIEECIYGIDIQTIAVQISKLRFFISLIVEQGDIDLSNPENNYGVWTLPNLETKFVAANTLISLKNNHNNTLDLTTANESKLKELKDELLNVRKRHFYAESKNEKIKLREEDASIRFHMKSYLTTPDEIKIEKFRNKIIDLENSKKQYKDKKWTYDEFNTGIQGSLFEEKEVPKELIKIDINKKYRDNIDKTIKQLERDIEKEKNKGKNDCLKQFIEMISNWNPYDQNATSSFFDSLWMFGVEDGFDIVIGNPPYIQLAKNKGRLAKQYQEEGFKTFARTGDIYSLFYEKGYNLLAKKGILCYITSNKWMRSGYGEKTRNFFKENTNPIQLIDFGGIKVFESATVDTNILLFAKENNTFSTRACTIKDKELKNLSNYFTQNSNICRFDSADSWVILSPIEQSIKQKIEAIGTPLKNWNINIYRGVLTGYNEAFIISGTKRNEILSNCKTQKERENTDKIIRPLLRGRDIKRYSYDFADLYLITTFPSLNLDIDEYPAVKNHLLSFGIERLEQTGKTYKINGKTIKARKKTNNKWFETQDSISYWEDFYKQKIAWNRIASTKLFSLIDEGVLIQDSMHFFTGERLEYLCAVLNSNLFRWFLYLIIGEAAGGNAGNSDNIKNLNVFNPSNLIEKKITNLMKAENYEAIDKEIYKLYNLTEEEISFIEK